MTGREGGHHRRLKPEDASCWIIENVFNLGYTDVRANSVGLVMDFTQSPRPFGTPIPEKYSSYYMENEAPSGVIPDNE